MSFGKAFVVPFLALALSAAAFADEDGAFLDKPYRNLQHPTRMDAQPESRSALATAFSALPRKSDTLATVRFQSPVKSQASRGTCSIFSATAMLESMLIKQQSDEASPDLAEEWLEYVIISERSKWAGENIDDGSSSNSNFAALEKYGSFEESLMPYDGQAWSDASFGLPAERCGSFESETARFKACLLGHYDPQYLTSTNAEIQDAQFVKARTAARKFAREHTGEFEKAGIVYDVAEVKTLLRAGVPVTLDIDFYYGAWNHRKAPSLGIARDEDQWNRGIVGYPLRGSVDYVNSRKERAGHSVVVVGYDDSVEVLLSIPMTDGTVKEVTYKGVYYFKNSWGTSGFGVSSDIEGENLPGYGTMVQQYAEEHGQFFKLFE